jgi:hypothetical protein
MGHVASEIGFKLTTSMICSGEGDVEAVAGKSLALTVAPAAIEILMVRILMLPKPGDAFTIPKLTKRELGLYVATDNEPFASPDSVTTPLLTFPVPGSVARNVPGGSVNAA